jgi:chromosome segregation ATPase
MAKAMLLEKEVEKSKQMMASASEALSLAELDSHSAHSEEFEVEKEKHKVLLQQLEKLKNKHMQYKVLYNKESQSELTKYKSQVEKLRNDILNQTVNHGVAKLGYGGVESKKEVLIQKIESISKTLTSKRTELNNIESEIDKAKKNRVELEQNKSELLQTNKHLKDEMMKQKFQYNEEVTQWEKKLREVGDNEVKGVRTVETFPARMRKKVKPISMNLRVIGSLNHLKASNFVI